MRSWQYAIVCCDVRAAKFRGVALNSEPGVPFLSVLMPVLNEGRTLARVIEEVLEVPDSLELLIVDDGSTDDTWEIAQRYVDDRRVRAWRHTVNRGKGAAVATALKEARGEYVVVQDADLEYSPSEYAALLKPIRSGRAQVVYGVRTFTSHSAYSFWYVMGNRAICMATNVLYNCYLRDVLTCYKVLPRDVAASLDLHATGFDFDPEITGKLLRAGHRIYEVPITYAARSREEGKKVTPADGVTALITLAKLRFGRRIVTQAATPPLRVELEGRSGAEQTQPAEAAEAP
jgi:glycosyltransferase involved in cell wall biosynthesis